MTPFRQSDVRRAIKAAKSAGETVHSVVIDNNGRIRLELVGDKTSNPADDWFEGREKADAGDA